MASIDTYTTAKIDELLKGKASNLSVQAKQSKILTKKPYPQTALLEDTLVKLKEEIDTKQDSGSYAAADHNHDGTYEPVLAAPVLQTKSNAQGTYVHSLEKSGNKIYYNTQPLNKGAVGLGNVDNTSDANKPISATTQAALDKKLNITRGSSVSTATTGYWAAMCNHGQAGNPVLPSNGWWHVLSMDWSGSDPNNWISQLALPTQDNNHLYYRKNNGGSNIDNAKWTKVADYDDLTAYQTKSIAPTGYNANTVQTCFEEVMGTANSAGTTASNASQTAAQAKTAAQNAAVASGVAESLANDAMTKANDAFTLAVQVRDVATAKQNRFYIYKVTVAGDSVSDGIGDISVNFIAYSKTEIKTLTDIESCLEKGNTCFDTGAGISHTSGLYSCIITDVWKSPNQPISITFFDMSNANQESMSARIDDYLTFTIKQII